MLLTCDLQPLALGFTCSLNGHCVLVILYKDAFIECKGYAHVRPLFALGTHVPRDTGGYADKLYVTLRCQLPGKPVPDGLQERPTPGPLGLCGRGVCIRLF